jgi:integrase
LLADQARGQHVERSDQHLGDYLNAWLSWKRAQVSARTYERYASLVRSSIIPALGGVRLQDLSVRHLDNFYATSLKTEAGQKKGSTLSPTTVHHRHVVLKMALQHAVRTGLIVRNPAEFASPPRPARPQLPVLGPAEAEQLLASVSGTPVELPTYLALTTGARLGELLALRWSDIDFRAGVAHINRTLVEHMLTSEQPGWHSFKEPKSGHGRSVDLGEATIERLKSHQRTQAERTPSISGGNGGLDLVLATRYGEPIRPSSVSTAFRETTARAGIHGVRFHDLRHAHATILLNAGTPAHVVSKRLGHSTVAFTLQVYAHVLPGQQKQAAEAIETALAGHTDQG